MKKTLLLGIIAVGAAFAAGSTVKVNIFRDSTVEGKALKAGDYKISMENGNAVIARGKQTIEVPAREETDANKFDKTELIYNGDASSLREIAVGGTHTRIIFEESSAAHSGL
jgi:hypothetical protein